MGKLLSILKKVIYYKNDKYYLINRWKMITLLGIDIQLPSQLNFLAAPLPIFVLNLLAWLVLAAFIYWVITPALKRFTRALPGEVEDIVLGIVRRPLSLLVFMIGLRVSIKYLQPEEDTQRLLIRISMTLIIMLVGHITGRIIRDVLVYYGENWARRTESQVDDILLPVLSLFGPLLLIIIAGLIILPMWGLDVSSVLLGAGVLGLVLGLALQETLSNIFSGLSLLIEAPFRRGDLIRLVSGKICEVQRLGLRSTTLLSLDEQATIYMPNKILAADYLVNLTKPTAEQRFSIAVSVAASNDLSQVKETLHRVAAGHPAVLGSDLELKVAFIHSQVERVHAWASGLSREDQTRFELEKMAEDNEFAITRLRREGSVNSQLLLLKEEIREMIRGIRSRETSGLSREELEEIIGRYAQPVENAVATLVSLTSEWVVTPDRWLSDRDFWQLRRLWDTRTEELWRNWDNLKKYLEHPDDRVELRLDDLSASLIDWLDKEYKIVPGVWKDPMVEIKNVSADTADLELHYYVDNIRLEMDGRPRRIRSELNHLIRHEFVQEGIWS